MPPSVAGSASAAAERTAAKLDAIRSKMPSATKVVRIEAKYDVVLDYPNLELHSAAASGNVGLVHYALTHGQPVNSLLHGCLPLHAASSGGNVTVVRMLIERGADVNAPRLPRRYSDNKKTSNMPAVGTTGSTPLHFAAANGHPPVVQLLLACGAVADKPDKNGMTPEDLAEMSGHAGVVHTIRVWRQMNGIPPPPGLDAADVQEAPSAGPSRTRRRGNSVSSQWTESDTGGESPAPGAAASATSPVPSHRKLERASSVVSLASEKGISRLRSSFDNVRNGVRLQPIKTPFAKQQQQQLQAPSTPQQQSEPSTPRLLITNSTPPQPERSESQIETPTLGSPFFDSLPSSEPEEMPPQLLSPASASSESLEPIDQSGYPLRSSRCPSLPSITEKAGHPNNSSLLKSENEQYPSITESQTTSPLVTTPSTGGSSFFRGRGRNADRRINKQAILGLFRRGGASPHSRSPSPPRKTEATRPIDVNEVDANVEALKRASMDPELMRMAIVAAELSEQLEANETNSAPVTKTRFFEDITLQMVPQSLSSGPVLYERPWERRKGSVVMSPSPLARQWSGVEDDNAPRMGIRRTRTEVRRGTSSGSYPRRMPSEPQLAAASIARRRSMVGSSYSSRVVSDPASMSSTPADSPLPLPSDAEAADDEREDVIESAMESMEALAVSRVDASPVDAPPDIHESTPEETEEENDSSPSAADLPSLTLDVADSELTSSTELKEPDASNLSTSGRFRGESIGSTTTESSRGLRTPPSSMVSPLGNGPVRRDSIDSDFTLMSPEKDKPRLTRSRGQSETSMASVLAAGFPPVPEHATAETDHRPRPPVRRVSTHAEAHDMMRQTERGVLEIAQMPMTSDSARSLADQLAAYGDSHALAEEFARAEKMSTTSSSERNSVASSDSAKRRSMSSSGRMMSRSPPRVYSGSVPAIGKIYDLREQAYRDRLHALASATPIYGMRSTVQRSRTVSGDHPAHRTRSSASDTWLSPSTANALSHRRLTDPSASGADRLGRVEHGLPMAADPLGIRPSQKNRPRPARPSSSLKGLTPLNPASPRAHASSLGAPGFGGLAGAAGSVGLGRSVSLHRPNDKVNSVRYQGLAQARTFAASANPEFIPGHGRRVSDGSNAFEHKLGNGHGHSHSLSTLETALRTSDDEWRPPAATYVPSEAEGHKSGRWGQLKGAIGNLRR